MNAARRTACRLTVGLWALNITQSLFLRAQLDYNPFDARGSKPRGGSGRLRGHWRAAGDRMWLPIAVGCWRIPSPARIWYRSKFPRLRTEGLHAARRRGRSRTRTMWLCLIGRYWLPSQSDCTQTVSISEPVGFLYALSMADVVCFDQVLRAPCK